MSLKLNNTVDEDEDQLPMQQVYDVLASCLALNTTSPLDQVARELDRLGSETHNTNQDNEHLDSYTFLLRFWEVTIPLAYQIPFDHPAQDRLVELISKLAALPEDITGKWRHLRCVGEILQDIWRGK